MAGTLIILFSSLSGCEKSLPAINENSHICEVSELGVGSLSVCKDADTFAYLPRSYGNAQLPIIAAAESCDLTKSVVHNNGGVACIFTGARLREIESNRKKKEAEKKPTENASQK